MPTPYGYDVQQIDAPRYISRGEFDVTGTLELDAFTPLKLHSTSFDSGAFGVSGIYRVRQLAAAYNDISGMSGCIGVSIRKIRSSTNTGLRNQNIIRRKMAVLHFGPTYMRYESGTLDGSPVTLRYGDKIAPCTSGFRAYQELNYTTITEVIGTGYADCAISGYVLTTGSKSDVAGVVTTGNRQTCLGYYADVASNLTGTWKKVVILPHNIYGAYP